MVVIVYVVAVDISFGCDQPKSVGSRAAAAGQGHFWQGISSGRASRETFQREALIYLSLHTQDYSEPFE